MYSSTSPDPRRHRKRRQSLTPVLTHRPGVHRPLTKDRRRNGPQSIAQMPAARFIFPVMISTNSPPLADVNRSGTIALNHGQALPLCPRLLLVRSTLSASRTGADQNEVLANSAAC